MFCLHFNAHQPGKFPFFCILASNNSISASSSHSTLAGITLKKKGALKLLAAPLIILRHVSLIGSGDHILAAMELKFCTGTTFMFLDLP